jgi:hypothetical protein
MALRERLRRRVNRLLVRTGAVPTTASVNDYDEAIYYLITDNIGTNSTIGWLEVQYTV